MSDNAPPIDAGPFGAGYDNEGRPWADRWPERHKTAEPKQATDPAVADDTKESVKRTKEMTQSQTQFASQGEYRADADLEQRMREARSGLRGLRPMDR